MIDHFERGCWWFHLFFIDFIDFIFIPPLPGGGGGILFYLCPSVHPSKIFFVTFSPYRAKRFWTHQIPTSCLLTLVIFIHIEHICTFFVAFFSATIDGRYLIFRHKLHIGVPYCWKNFWDPYMLIFRCIFLSKYWW